MDEGGSGETKSRMQKLREGLAELQDCRSRGDIYNKTVQLVELILDFDFCALQLHEENTLIARGNNSNQGREVGSFVLGEDLSEITLSRGEVIWDEELDDFSDLDHTPGRFRSFISVPIEDIGSLQVFSSNGEEFSEEDANLLQVLAIYFRERLARADLEENLRDQAIHDQLTGLYNRHYLHEVLAKEVERAQRYEHTLSFLMVDINGFKEVNDRYSHTKGDQVLKQIGRVLESNVRDVDTVIRYGGDEFLILLPETGDGSRVVVDRLRDEVRNWSEESNLLDFNLSIAIGSSNFDPNEEIDMEKKITQADKNMYRDKEKLKG